MKINLTALFGAPEPPAPPEPPTYFAYITQSGRKLRTEQVMDSPYAGEEGEWEYWRLPEPPSFEAEAWGSDDGIVDSGGVPIFQILPIEVEGDGAED
jgi:hypothetical protein